MARNYHKITRITMPNYDYDLFVIGAGSGGLAAAKRATLNGATAAVCENSKVGGTCVIRGCVPKKIMSYAGNIADTLEDAKGYGFDVSVKGFDFGSFVAKRNAEIDRLNNLHITLLEKAGVDLHLGHGEIIDKHTVKVADKTFTAKNIMIATGGRATKLNIPGAELGMTSDGLWELNELPKRMVVMGSGYIAVEFASIFNAIGTEVHLVFRKDYLLTNFDRDCRIFLQEELEKRGIIFHTEQNPVSIEKSNNGLVLNTDQNKSIEADVMLFATGRSPIVDNIGLDKVGIETFKGAITVNDKLQTNVENIYAVGDVTDRVNLTPIAIRDGRLVSDNLFKGTHKEIDDENVPTAVFTTPPVGTVGLTEAEAIELHGEDNVRTSTAKFRPMLYVLPNRDEKAFMKLVIRKEDDVVLGCHMVGRDAAEIIQGFGVAIKMGATVADLNKTIAIHPSSAEEFVLMQ